MKRSSPIVSFTDFPWVKPKLIGGEYGRELARGAGEGVENVGREEMGGGI